MSFSVTSTMSPRLAGIMASAAYFAVMMRDVSPCRKIASALFRSACQRKPYNNEMSPRRRKAVDVDVFAGTGASHAALRTCGADTAGDRRGGGRDGGRSGAALWFQARTAARARPARRLHRRHRLWRAAGRPDGFAAPGGACRHGGSCQVGGVTSRRTAESRLPAERPGGPGAAPPPAAAQAGGRGLVTSSWWPMPYLWANSGPIPTFGRWRA